MLEDVDVATSVVVAGTRVLVVVTGAGVVVEVVTGTIRRRCAGATIRRLEQPLNSEGVPETNKTNRLKTI